MNGALSAAVLSQALAVDESFVLRLDSSKGANTFVERIEGGEIFADVVTTGDAALHYLKKQPGSVQYSAFEVPLGLSMAQELFEWIASSWGPQPDRKSGSLLAVDFNLNVKAEKAFVDALVSETTFPALDGASKDAGAVVVRAQPTALERRAGSGKLSVGFSKKKLWRTSNFRLQIDGLDCMAVARIESFTVKREITVVRSGTGRVSLAAGLAQYPNLFVTLPQASAKTWYDWHESFVVLGKNDDSSERSGSIAFLAVDLKTELARISLQNVGILKLSRAEDRPGQVTAALYVEVMALS